MKRLLIILLILPSCYVWSCGEPAQRLTLQIPLTTQECMGTARDFFASKAYVSELTEKQGYQIGTRGKFEIIVDCRDKNEVHLIAGLDRASEYESAFQELVTHYKKFNKALNEDANNNSAY